MLVVLVWLGQSPVFAQSVTLTWNPSPDTNAVGYKIYYGETSDVYTGTVYVANATTTTATVSGLTGGVTYYFSATTVDASGLESPFSNETTYMPAASTNTVTGTNSTPSAPQPPTLDPVANVTIYTNAGTQTINLTGISAGTSGNATVNVYAVSSDNGTVISTPTVSYANPNSTGTLTFAPVATGTATVTVTVDNGGTSNNPTSQVFTVTVQPVPVNTGLPTVNPISNVTIYENAGLQTVPLNGIATGLSGGYQYVTIWAYTGNASIIPAPTVNYTSPNSAR